MFNYICNNLFCSRQENYFVNISVLLVTFVLQLRIYLLIVLRCNSEMLFSWGSNLFNWWHSLTGWKQFRLCSSNIFLTFYLRGSKTQKFLNFLKKNYCTKIFFALYCLKWIANYLNWNRKYIFFSKF